MADTIQDLAAKYGATATPVSQSMDPMVDLAAKYGATVRPASLPEVTNSDLAKFGKGAISALPWVGGTVGALMAPEVAGAGWLLNTAIGAGSAALGGAAGSAVEQGVKTAAGTDDRAKSIGDFAGRVGEEAAAQGAGELFGRAVTAPFSFALKKLAPASLYQSALKPSVTLSVPERNQIIQTGLSGYPTSETGYGNLVNSVGELSHRINMAVADKSIDVGAAIDPKIVGDRLDALIAHYQTQGYPDADVADIQRIRNAYMERHSYEAPYTEIRPGADEASGTFVPTGTGSTTINVPMTLAEAQAEKQGTYRFNKASYGQLSNAQTEAEKNIAHTLREQITNLFPEVASLNKQDGALIDLEAQLRRFVGREGNKNMVALIPAVIGTGAGLAGGLASSNPTTGAESGIGAGILAMSVMALDNPEIKSKLAIALAKAAKTRLGTALTRLAPEALPAASRAVGSAIVPQEQNRMNIGDLMQGAKQ